MQCTVRRALQAGTGRKATPLSKSFTRAHVGSAQWRTGFTDEQYRSPLLNTFIECHGDRRTQGGNPNPGVSSFSCKGPESKHRGPWRPCCLFHDGSALSLAHTSRHTRRVNERAQLCSNKTFLINAGGPGLALGVGFASPFPSTGALDPCCTWDLLVSLESSPSAWPLPRLMASVTERGTEASGFLKLLGDSGVWPR